MIERNITLPEMILWTGTRVALGVGIGMLISTLTDAQVLSLTGQQGTPDHDPVAVLRACVGLYDQRGGGVETVIKRDPSVGGRPDPLAQNAMIAIRPWR